MERKKVIAYVYIHNHICISNDLNVQYTVRLSFRVTHHGHHRCYQRAKIKGSSALNPLPDSIEKCNFDKPQLARIGLFAYGSRLGPFPGFQAARLKVWRFQVTVSSFFPTSQAEPRARVNGKLKGKFSITPWGQPSLLPTCWQREAQLQLCKTFVLLEGVVVKFYKN